MQGSYITAKSILGQMSDEWDRVGKRHTMVHSHVMSNYQPPLIANFLIHEAESNPEVCGKAGAAKSMRGGGGAGGA